MAVLAWTGVIGLILLCCRGCYCQCPSQGCLCNDKATICHTHAQLDSIPMVPSSTINMTIYGNSIRYISSDDLKNLTELKNLKLRFGKIEFISFSAFLQNSKLKFLNLAFNKITELVPLLFRNQTSLETLILKNNMLSTVRDSVFYGLSKLKILNLSNNRLSEVIFSSMKPLKSLTTLDLSGNPLKCDCGMSWMKVYSPISQSQPVICATPLALAGRSISTVSFQELHCALPSVAPMTRTLRAFEGEGDLNLRCQVSGDPKPAVVWYFKGRKLEDALHYRLPEDGSLWIFVMRPQLAGNYTCRAQNIMGSVNGTISLEYAGTRLPIFQQTPSNVHAFVGSSFSLPCVADEVTDTYQWFKGDQVLTSDSKLVIQPGTGLSVRLANKNHSGTYYCIASNEMGSVNVSAVVSITNTVITCDGVIAPSIIEGFREKVNLAFNRTREELFASTNSPSSLLRRLKFPNSGIIEYLKAAEVFDQAVAMIRNQLTSTGAGVEGDDIPDLSSCELEVLGRLSGCEEHRKEANCSSCFHHHYRSIDGSCNNLDYPLQGSADSPFKRLLTPSYEDGVGLPVGWSGNKVSARVISSKLFSASKVDTNENYTLMLMQIGQFLDHDIDLSPVSPSNIVFNNNEPGRFSSCNSICHNDAPCFPIPVPSDDPRIRRDCMSFTRSSAVCGTGAPSLLVGTEHIHREQINAITSYIDGSMVYSSIDSTATKLRELGTGKLKEGIKLTLSGKPLLPFDNESLIECATGIHANRSQCFLGGDVRTNEQVGLTTMHTLFLREHNRIVQQLMNFNPHWEGEKLYQEARKILSAQWQHIIYTEFLPLILGPNFLGTYDGYNSTMDARISNAFATAAYRFGHSLIMPFFPRLDSNYESLPIGALGLQHAFFSPFRIIEEGGIEPLLRGLISTPVKKLSSHQGLTKNLTEALFSQANDIALDLAALNIQRGRDHGLPSYNRWRSFCGLEAPDSIEELKAHIGNATIRQQLVEMFEDNPDNIDLWVGGLLEDILPGAMLGPTFQCIIGEQFKRLRTGDRFFYEREGQFTPDQLVQIKQSSLSRLICDNADGIIRVPVHALKLQNTSEFVPCAVLPTVDLFLWKDCNENCVEPSSRTKRSLLFQPSRNEIQAMNKKMSHLEEKIGACSFNGTLYASGQSWSISTCRKCSCQRGDTQCTYNCLV